MDAVSGSSKENGRTHEPNLREIVAELDGMVKLYEERDRRYTERFDSQEKAVVAALAAAEKLVGAAFAASEKAITKAEVAQSDYNVRTNEFRGQLSDQAKTLMPRQEAETTFKQYRELLDAQQREFRTSVEQIKADTRALFETSRTDITALRESQSEGSGRRAQQVEWRSGSQWAISAIIGAAAVVLSLLFGSGGLPKPSAPPPTVIYVPAPPAPAPVTPPRGAMP